MPNKTLTLSIVIPVYNEQRYLKACLDSIAQQSLMPNEVLVVDNNSTDQSLEIAKKYPFVRIIQEKRRGIAYARSAGFNAAQSDVIGRIDADTRLDLDWAERTLEYLKLNNHTQAVTGDCYFYDFPFRRLFHAMHKTTYYVLQRWIAGTNILWGSNMAVRRSAWQNVKDQCSAANNIHEDISV